MLLQLRGMRKRFGGVQALANGCLDVRAGEAHLLLGENGAGKSTLMKIAAGMYCADGGELLWLGERCSFRNPAEAQRVGIAMVHQESLLAPHLTVAQNVWLGREPGTGWGLLKSGEIEARTRALIEQHGFPLRADWRVEKLGPAGRQLVEICRALAQDSSLLIFDEPTSALAEGESAEVLRITGELKRRGLAVIYITHRMRELREVGDRATVLRDGSTVFSSPMADVTNNELIRHMAGRKVSEDYRRTPVQPGREMLRVEGLTRKNVLHGIDLSVRAGEVVGIAGLVGSGRTELCRALFGVDRIDGGRIVVDGKRVRIASPQEAVKEGIVLVPEDRQRHGLVAGRPVGENLSLAALERWSAGGVIRQGRERRAVAERIEGLRLKCGSPAQLAGKLSGGTQQKTVIGKWVMRGAKVYLFDEPARGIDIGAKREVFELMDTLARQGAALLMVSSELTELIQAADRILVMRQGRIVAQCAGQASQEEILRHATMGGEA